MNSYKDMQVEFLANQFPVKILDKPKKPALPADVVLFLESLRFRTDVANDASGKAQELYKKYVEVKNVK